MAQGMVKERNRCRCYLPVFHNAKVTPAHLSYTAGFSVDRLIALNRIITLINRRTTTVSSRIRGIRPAITIG
ncbi:unnamed protein product [Clonostachys rosea f. rosea IK726]|uniref:Uncharacterized protein n=1 Tax=Clonostachys rosea f. rosea IK726 TaxID=1349383 RepID=A0ACA9U6R3_BIOOC|nr:unnamed protein product [Clonostachys rosea f. rosea IK726]